MKQKRETKKCLIEISGNLMTRENSPGISVWILLFVLGTTAACSSVPKVTITEEEHLTLQRRVRVLERELAETTADYEAAKGEALLTRERIRTIEYPMTALEQKQLENAGSCKDRPEYDYYGSTYSEEKQRSYDLFTKRGE